ncbi:TnsA-like heteromeric transposase endonuclease subunit [Mycobacteroides sp. PCS013]|uniref:TnsA-like heteromeric transposase endonuclease subunit n=1 Tax=Mycobacteroides sp. PCS013 TaxID=3074106 RepID=UPI003C2B0336
MTAVRLADADPSSLIDAYPWREFRWRAGQKHYSGAYWSATEGRHVIYESRLELARLLFADFDRSVNRICAQPFLLVRESNGVWAKHIPDYLLQTDQGPMVVDVKPVGRLSRPEVASTFAWTRSAIEGRGWQYEVWSEPNAAELQNVRFLAGFRRRSLFDPAILAALRAISIDDLSISKAIGVLQGWPGSLARSALLHLIWSQEFGIDMSRPLSHDSTLTRES